MMKPVVHLSLKRLPDSTMLFTAKWPNGEKFEGIIDHSWTLWKSIRYAIWLFSLIIHGWIKKFDVEIEPFED